MAPMLLLDNKPANLEHKPSPSRHYPLRGLSEQTRRSVEDPHAIPLPCPRHLRLPSHTPPGHVARSQKSSTGRDVLDNTDAIDRLLTEFETLAHVASLRRCNRQLRSIIDDNRDMWQKVHYSPPGLSRIANLSHQQGEKVLRRGAEKGNVEAQMMLALMNTPPDV
ncbi:hypothetical protein T484DRAFT_1773076 [Baffinella frigidus]|nr:hypothetical protein T484DRAFT_1773076 [Cryptophyta sp. CCMP2293]